VPFDAIFNSSIRSKKLSCSPRADFSFIFGAGVLTNCRCWSCKR
jgi:hypothetical protein